MSNATKKDILRVAGWVALVGLPALATLWMTLSGTWGVDPVISQQIGATITAIDAFLGAILGVSEQRVNRAILKEFQKDRDELMGIYAENDEDDDNDGEDDD